MSGQVIEFFIIMWIVGALAFAPIGYFIFMYTKRSGRPFGETEPHGDSPSLVNDLANKLLATLRSLLNKQEVYRR